jgi:formamidopyrimidine-DNA glycosylase
MGGWVYHSNDKFQYADHSYGLEGVKHALSHLNVEFKFGHESVYFYDQISQGTLKIIKGRKELDKKLSALGPDIMDINTTFVLFKNQIKKEKNLHKPIGNVLMDQKIVSGIGNYLRADILWMSKINPFRNVSTLTDGELLDIYKNARILTWGEYDRKKAVELKIISKQAKLPSDYNRDFFVYRQEKDINDNVVKSNELYEGSNKRTIFWVSEVQK